MEQEHLTQPLITGTTHTLPFDKLSPRDFERLCLWLMEREGYERAEHLGAAGSEQGRDIVAWREGALWAFQCKRVQRFGPKDALAEVEKVLALPQDQRPAGLVFLVTCDVLANTRQQVRDRCAGEMECHFWAGTELDEKVKRHPDIVEEFFQARSRHIPKEVTSKLLEDMRHRCCICRVLIDPQRFDTEAQFDSLEKHHIIHFSEGGGNTYDNLLLVCANCHTQIHRHPEKYPMDKLRERKLHWIGVKEVVAPKLRMTDETQDAIQVTFSVESVNLQYSVVASPQTTVSQLALFVRDKILKPLGEYDNNDNWLHIEAVALALRSAPEEALSANLSLRDIELAPDDVLVANISVPLILVFR